MNATQPGRRSASRDIMAMKPGERRLQILQTLAAMLENPRGEKVTTAALAAKLDVSEAALYRHFASKAQMFEGLIEFIETTLFSLVNRITTETTDGVAQAEQTVVMLLVVRREESGHDARADRRRAGQRGRAAAGAHEPARPTSSRRRCASRCGSRRRPTAGTAMRRPTPPCCSRTWSAAGSCSPRAASSACRRTAGTLQRKFLFG